MTTTESPAALGALRIAEDGRAYFFSVRPLSAVRVKRFVELADRTGLTRPAVANDTCFAVLDIYDAAGDVIDDRAVPTEAAWNALNSELGLSVVAVES